MSQRVGAIAGLSGAILMSVLLIIVALAYRGAANETYSPFNHFVSELGHTGDSELWPGFSAAVILGGLSFVAAMYAFALPFTGWARWALTILGAITGICGLLVGVFPMDTANTGHTYSALGFFLGALLTVGMFSAVIALSKQAAYPRWLVIPSLLPVISLIVFLATLIERVSVVGAEGSLQVPVAERAAVQLLSTSEWAVIIFLNVWMIVTAVHVLSRYPVRMQAARPNPI